MGYQSGDTTVEKSVVTGYNSSCMIWHDIWTPRQHYLASFDCDWDIFGYVTLFEESSRRKAMETHMPNTIPSEQNYTTVAIKQRKVNTLATYVRSLSHQNSSQLLYGELFKGVLVILSIWAEPSNPVATCRSTRATWSFLPWIFSCKEWMTSALRMGDMQ